MCAIGNLSKYVFNHSSKADIAHWAVCGTEATITSSMINSGSTHEIRSKWLLAQNRSHVHQVFVILGICHQNVVLVRLGVDCIDALLQTGTNHEAYEGRSCA